ncbi:hypothetical protein AVEN_242207-1 [Araneus ventricosus]|uniref:Uncharacterized protein n=1 Tax=Araneus ventricosus TaxID=182803 RepID=A0A4Y2C1A5_ARAVE|nr:hypothetical protein AVEN_242207-1 [Araneus ventricosus]
MPFVKSIDFGMKRQNSFDVSNPAGSGRIDGNPAGSDRIEIGAGLQSLIPTSHYLPTYLKTQTEVEKETVLVIKGFVCCVTQTTSQQTAL